MPAHRLLYGWSAVVLPLALALVLVSLGTATSSSTGQSADALVVVAKLDDTIHPITAEYVVAALADAAERRADLFVLELSTPGGLDLAMRDIIQAILASSVPVCVYVSPEGARAASAGFVIAMAAEFVAMAPNTNTGAATPVSVGIQQMDEAMANKAVQDAVAYVRSLADGQGRPADVAAEAVSLGRSFAAEEAVALGLADFIAADLDELLAHLEGSSRPLVGNDEQLIRLEEARVEFVEMTTRQRVLAILANPQIAYMLMLAGMAGLYFELSTPGAVLPGVVGAMSLVLALLAFQVLPISYAGLALIGLAILFLIAEIKVTSYGLLTIAGLVSFVLGSVMLVPGPIPEMTLQLSFVLPMALSVAGIAGFLMWLVIGTHRNRVQTGPPGLVNEVGRARNDLRPDDVGDVFVHGEIWRAYADVPIRSGDPIEVVAVGPGMVLSVRPASQKGRPR